MNNFDLSDMRDIAHEMLRKRATVDDVRLTLSQRFDKYTFTLRNDGSIVAVSDDADYAVPTRVVG